MNTKSTAYRIRRELAQLADAGDARFLRRFFKTGPGEYGEGDRFRGIRVPRLRACARRHRSCPPDEMEKLLQSPFHEDRLCALFIMVLRFQQGGERERERLHRLYLANLDRVNNWDLVDASAEHLIGPRLMEGDRALFRTLCASPSLWKRRIAMMSTFSMIKAGRIEPALAVAEALLDDSEDLIHKAVGWMLREIGNRDRSVEERFLRTHYREMPRTMLRYAIEKFPEPLRLRYLRGDTT